MENSGDFPTSIGAEAEKVLAAIRADNRLRTLRPNANFNPRSAASPSQEIDLTSNDYLNLRMNPIHQAFLKSAVSEFPMGAGGSRLLGGEHPIFFELEHAMANFSRSESALFFSSGFAANESVATSLAKIPGVRFFSDQFNHASLIDGIRMSGLAKADRVIYPHGDLDRLESELGNSRDRINIIFTESLFSMDGDSVDLARLEDLAKRYNGFLVIDEAHSFFCSGPEGLGLASAFAIDTHRWARVITCGKAMGLSGAFICGPSWLRDLLINTARPFIYSTAPSPTSAAAVLATLKVSNTLEAARTRLKASSRWLREQLLTADFNLGNNPQHHILPIILGDNETALDMSETLANHQIISRAIRPPTVPSGTARIRISLHAGLTDAEMEKTLSVILKYRAKKTKTVKTQ